MANDVDSEIVQRIKQHDFSELGPDYLFGGRLKSVIDELKHPDVWPALNDVLSNGNDVLSNGNDSKINTLWHDADLTPDQLQAARNVVQGWSNLLQWLQTNAPQHWLSAAEAFDEAWPAELLGSEPSVHAAPDGSLRDAWLQQNGRTIGFFVAEAIEAALGAESDSTGNAASGSARLPAVLARGDYGEVIGLRIELFADERTVFYPDPLALGWTVITRDASSASETRKTDNATPPDNETLPDNETPPDKGGFHNAMQSVWKGLASHLNGVRGSWAVMRENGDNKPGLAVLDGRSLEAATACVLLAAKQSEDVLDEYMAVSATLTIAPELDWRDWKLGPITSLPQKLAAVAGERLVLIVSEKQDFGDLEVVNELADEESESEELSEVWHWKDEKERTVQIYKLETLGEVYDLLMQSHRFMRDMHHYHETLFTKEFDGEWPEDAEQTEDAEDAEQPVGAPAGESG